MHFEWAESWQSVTRFAGFLKTTAFTSHTRFLNNTMSYTTTHKVETPMMLLLQHHRLNISNTGTWLDNHSWERTSKCRALQCPPNLPDVQILEWNRCSVWCPALSMEIGAFVVLVCCKLTPRVWLQERWHERTVFAQLQVPSGVHAKNQQFHSDSRLAHPYGCHESAVKVLQPFIKAVVKLIFAPGSHFKSHISLAVGFIRQEILFRRPKITQLLLPVSFPAYKMSPERQT